MQPETHCGEPAALRFRRQFLLGPQPAKGLEGWRRLVVKEGLHLAAHPDLVVDHAAAPGKSLTVVGHMLDPRHPEATNAAILQTLLKRLEPDGCLDRFFHHTYGLGGRWALVVENRQGIRLYHDAAGMRQVYYTVVENGPNQGVWCGAQAAILAEVLCLQPDGTLVQQIEATKTTAAEYWWPGGKPRYREVGLLLPNHYLDLTDGTTHRYWPSAPASPLPLDTGVDKACGLLQGMMLAAGNRFGLALPLTAGRDSRVILAASRAMRDELYYYTLIYYDLNRWSADVRIPRRLLRRVGLPHHVLQCPSKMEPGFEAIYKTNVSDAHDAWGVIAQGLLQQAPADRVCVRGTVSEIARSFYMPWREKPEPQRGRELALYTGQEQNEFMVDAIETWLTRLGDPHGYHVLDLFYWEHRMGVWGATSYAEWDIAQDVFSPYNCRELLVDMLAVEHPYRRPPDYVLYQRMIERMWPELLSEPLNPPRWRTRCWTTMDGAATSTLKRLGLYEAARRIKRALYRG